MDRVDAVVVGAGVVGLAVARALSFRGRETVVLESEETFGSGISSRNSEVVHAGIYYPSDSLKARLCVRGRKMLYDFCNSHSVAHSRLGKFIVASDESQLPGLSEIARAATLNGVGDLEIWDGAQVRAVEPELRCVQALRSPSTGIVDSHGLMLAYLGDLETHGGAVAYKAPFVSARQDGPGWVVLVGGAAPCEIGCATLVNSAGLQAIETAWRIEGLLPKDVPSAYYARGCYFRLTGCSPPFRSLVYPIPEPGGLGVHATIDLAGQVRFGPDVEWIDKVAFDVDAGRADRFYRAVRAYWPSLADDALQPAYAGVRPKISGPDEPAADFRIDGPDRTGLPGLVNLFGIESPGLTASLALADIVADALAPHPT